MMLIAVLGDLVLFKHLNSDNDLCLFKYRIAINDANVFIECFSFCVDIALDK